MSYYSRVEIQWDDHENATVVDVDSLLRCAEEYVRERGWHHDAIVDLRNALKGPLQNDGTGFNNLWAEGLEDLILSMSRGFPKVFFQARGCGEDIEDVWYREFQDGKIIRREGPFVDD